MEYLSLFSGAGGGDLAMQHLLGFRCRGYVEIEPYCQEVLKQRISDGVLDAAPIFGDIRKFCSEGYAGAYTDMVDLITGGFPCQPFSVAGKQLGADDPRNMWPWTIETIRTVRPQLAFLENVPGLLSKRYFGRILGDLAEGGFDARWKVISAAEVGAPHKRDRVWILANSINGRSQIGRAGCNEKNVYSRDENLRPEAKKFCPNVADSQVIGCINGNDGKLQRQASRKVNTFTSTSSLAGELETGWWETEPDVGRVAYGVASRVDRLKALGNGQVPFCAALAFKVLSGGFLK